MSSGVLRLPTMMSVAGKSEQKQIEEQSAWSGAEDGALVAACLAGHRAAFDPIVVRYRRQVYQVCYRFVGNHEDASDLAQEVFVRAYRGLHGFKGNAALATWLYRIAVNTSLNRLARKGPAVEPIGGRDLAQSAAEPADAAVLRAERAEAVRAAIAKLPRKQRVTVILRTYHELSHDEIATIVGSSVGAVKANFFHAMGNLRKLLGGA